MDLFDKTVRHDGWSVTGCLVLVALLVLLAAPCAMQAQNIGWEGETGVFVTPLAYTAASPDTGLGKPMVGFHFLNGGPVLGDFYEASVTEGVFGRVEFGYTRPLHSQSGDPTFGSLWTNGFNIVHGKVNVIKENAWKTKWVPAFSIGVIDRSHVHEVGGVVWGRFTRNQDFYAVATKLIPQTKVIPLLLTAGVRETNGELWGMGGNTPTYQAKVFGSIGFVVKLPKKASVVFASEIAQQPKHPDSLPNAVIPTTLTYAARLSPAPESKLNIDFGVAQIAGTIEPGVNLKARHQLGMQVGYQF
jgi:hypothetical protein